MLSADELGVLTSPTMYDPVASNRVIMCRHASENGWTEELGDMIVSSDYLYIDVGYRSA